MSTFTDRLKIVLDWEGEKANTGIRNLGKSMREAEGFFAKMKAGASAVGQSLQANMGAVAITAGAAMVAFGAKSVGAFTETAKAAIDFGKAAGFSTEEASRWIAVADDYQVSAEGISSATARISRDLDATKWDKYGIATREAGGAARSTNDIFLDSLDVLSRINNKTEQSHAAFELFGRGWQSMAPLIGKTRKEYESMLGAVENGQVITDGEAQSAEDWRLAMDDLGDAIHNVEIAVGGMVAKAAPTLKGLTVVINALAAAGQTVDITNQEGLDFDEANKAAHDYWGQLKTLNDVRLEGIDAEYQLNEALVSGKVTVEELNTIISDHQKLLASAVVEWQTTHQVIDEASAAEDEHARAIQRAGNMYPDMTQAMKEAAAAAREEEDALRAANDALLASVDDNFRAQDAQRSFYDAVKALVPAVDDANTTVDEAAEWQADYNKTLQTAQEDAMALAAAETAKAVAMAESTGAVVDAKTEHDMYVQQLKKVADGLAPGSELRTSLEQYILYLGRVPPDIQSQIDIAGAEDASTRIGFVKETADGLDGTTATVTVDTAGEEDAAGRIGFYRQKVDEESDLAVDALHNIADAITGLPEAVSIEMSVPGIDNAIGKLQSLNTWLQKVRDSAHQAESAVSNVAD